MRDKETLKLKKKILLEAKNAKLNIWIEPALFEFIQEQAREEGRTVSNLVRRVIKRYYNL